MTEYSHPQNSVAEEGTKKKKRQVKVEGMKREVGWGKGRGRKVCRFWGGGELLPGPSIPV